MLQPLEQVGYHTVELNTERGPVRNKLVLEEVINAARDHNILFITSAGNDGVDVDADNKKGYFPTNFDCENLIKVAGSIDSAIADGSNYGSKSVDFAAPFIITAQLFDNTGNSLKTVASAGTSFSAPIVTALAALEASYMSQFDWRKVKAALYNLPRIPNSKLKGGILNPFCD